MPNFQEILFIPGRFLELHIGHLLVFSLNKTKVIENKISLNGNKHGSSSDKFNLNCNSSKILTLFDILHNSHIRLHCHSPFLVHEHVPIFLRNRSLLRSNASF